MSTVSGFGAALLIIALIAAIAGLIKNSVQYTAGGLIATIVAIVLLLNSVGGKL